MTLANPDVVIERSFSNKPGPDGFPNHFAKIESYVTIISGPAMERHNAHPLTFRSDDIAARELSERRVTVAVVAKHASRGAVRALDSARASGNREPARASLAKKMGL
ncbi:hypothetical protein AfiDRAFT_0695 [Afipia sp. 1NLS2]|nr:hypothetical protein AfiDRAFT_0695 [Afipia sp. 1NLS2]MBE0704576.1 hypothetical protein [Afipia sp.]